MWGKVINILRKVLMIGAQSVPSIVAAYNPPLGQLLQSILQSVVNTEATGAAGLTLTKKEMALLGVQAAMPALQIAFSASGKPVVNEELFAAGVEKIQDGVVDVLNSTGIGTK